MLLTTLTLALASLAAGSPIEQRDSRTYRLVALGMAAGVPATFGPSPPLYNYQPTPNGELVKLAQSGGAPKFWSDLWRLDRNVPGSLVLSSFVGPGKCLDAGLSPGDGTLAKLWDCYPGAPQQTWVVVGNKIKLKDRSESRTPEATDADLCLDVKDGNTQEGVQLWTCYDNNPNQVWELRQYN